jgi:hypothetical protein
MKSINPAIDLAENKDDDLIKIDFKSIIPRCRKRYTYSTDLFFPSRLAVYN